MSSNLPNVDWLVGQLVRNKKLVTWTAAVALAVARGQRPPAPAPGLLGEPPAGPAPFRWRGEWREHLFYDPGDVVVNDRGAVFVATDEPIRPRLPFRFGWRWRGAYRPDQDYQEGDVVALEQGVIGWLSADPDSGPWEARAGADPDAVIVDEPSGSWVQLAVVDPAGGGR